MAEQSACTCAGLHEMSGVVDTRDSRGMLFAFHNYLPKTDVEDKKQEDKDKVSSTEAPVLYKEKRLKQAREIADEITAFAAAADALSLCHVLDEMSSAEHLRHNKIVKDDVTFQAISHMSVHCLRTSIRVGGKKPSLCNSERDMAGTQALFFSQVDAASELYVMTPNVACFVRVSEMARDILPFMRDVCQVELIRQAFVEQRRRKHSHHFRSSDPNVICTLENPAFSAGTYTMPTQTEEALSHEHGELHMLNDKSTRKRGGTRAAAKVENMEDAPQENDGAGVGTGDCKNQQIHKDADTNAAADGANTQQIGAAGEDGGCREAVAGGQNGTQIVGDATIQCGESEAKSDIAPVV